MFDLSKFKVKSRSTTPIQSRSTTPSLDSSSKDLSLSLSTDTDLLANLEAVTKSSNEESNLDALLAKKLHTKPPEYPPPEIPHVVEVEHNKVHKSQGNSFQ